MSQLDIAEPIGGTDFAPSEVQGRRLTVDDPRLKRMQRFHALMVAGAGWSGLILATWLACNGHPVSRLALALFAVFYLLAGCGITVGYHRYFTHRSFRAPALLKALLAIFGAMNGQGPVVYWVSVHRMHHMFSDRKGDPHSPNLHGDGAWNRLRGAAHAYAGWTVAHDVPNASVFSRDLLSDKTVIWVNRRYYLWLLLGWLLPAVLGGVISGTVYGALEGLLWGGLVRMLASSSAMYAISVFCHSPGVGDRAWNTEDYSRNNAWLAIPTLGDAWHNNHHAFPRAAVHGLRWWQLDISGMAIVLLGKLGIVSDICRPGEAEIRRHGLP
ncbi:MAG TPA: acyl-CoA desaturase [Burkholderiaceae bacterium]|jgi:stearoyl-CoA desaturase (delta-9 desaturase)